jgi:hypothetical protein
MKRIDRHARRKREAAMALRQDVHQRGEQWVLREKMKSTHQQALPLFCFVEHLGDFLLDFLRHLGQRRI